ncbi:hypothetical protein U9M48_021975 [Paspalum notatum var. saurae]|uniref:Transmembrane protein n=1 Tax=Paspalum notatum var. saurae TaxID=547442 RepID=A0AAQ3TGT0_PASNO
MSVSLVEPAGPAAPPHPPPQHRASTATGPCHHNITAAVDDPVHKLDGSTTVLEDKKDYLKELPGWLWRIMLMPLIYASLVYYFAFLMEEVATVTWPIVLLLILPVGGFLLFLFPVFLVVLWDES